LGHPAENKPTRFTFTKEERLCSQKLIGTLFSRGEQMTVYPFRILWLNTDDPNQPPVQVAITVPKRIFKRAVVRNRIKRMIREAYRLNKHLLYSKLNKKLVFVIIFIAREEPVWGVIQPKIILTLERLTKANEKVTELDNDRVD
jgi:ribonuclease P protein component